MILKNDKTTIVLLNGCFDINPVLCPSTVILSRGQLY